MSTISEEMKQMAHRLGQMIGMGEGDFYDIAEHVAAGYAEGTGRSGEYDLLAGRMIGADALRRASEDVTAWAVDDARDLRMTWAEIGEALDVSKQAAQQKYGK